MQELQQSLISILNNDSLLAVSLMLVVTVIVVRFVKWNIGKAFDATIFVTTAIIIKIIFTGTV